MPIDVPLANLDREQAFMLYATFTGDLERTAAALHIRPVDLLRIVDEEGWIEKLKPLIELRKSTRPGDFERAVNRTINFVDAHRLRLSLERIIARIFEMSPEDFQEYILTPEHIGSSGRTMPAKLSTRALADLASALEKCQMLTYMALNDSAPERAKRKGEDDSGESAADLHVKLAEAMKQVRNSPSVRARLLDAQLAIAESTKAKPEPAPNPYDKES